MVTTVSVVSDVDEFRQMGRLWDALVRKSAPSHPFLSHDWFLSWWNAFAGERRLHIVVVHEAGEPIAIAPLMRGRGRVLGVGLELIEPMLNDHTPRYEFILTRPAACRAIWEHLPDLDERWHVFAGRQLPSGSAPLEGVARCAAADSFLVGRRPGRRAAVRAALGHLGPVLLDAQPESSGQVWAVRAAGLHFAGWPPPPSGQSPGVGGATAGASPNRHRPSSV